MDFDSFSPDIIIIFFARRTRNKGRTRASIRESIARGYGDLYVRLRAAIKISEAFSLRSSPVVPEPDTLSACGQYASTTRELASRPRCVFHALYAVFTEGCWWTDA